MPATVQRLSVLSPVRRVAGESLAGGGTSRTGGSAGAPDDDVAALPPSLEELDVGAFAGAVEGTTCSDMFLRAVAERCPRLIALRHAAPFGPGTDLEVLVQGCPRLCLVEAAAPPPSRRWRAPVDLEAWHVFSED